MKKSLTIVMAAWVVAGCSPEDSDDTRATDEALVAVAAENAAASPPAAEVDIPNDYVYGPGGWSHPSCFHQVPDGAEVDADSGNVFLNGKLHRHYPPCPYKPISGRNTVPKGRSKAGPGTSGGWMIDWTQNAPTGVTFDKIVTDMIVPSAPTSQLSQTLYYFPGLQSTVNSNCGIIQPVLQWGVSPAGGGKYWSMASWWWGWTGQFSTPLTVVSSGNRLRTWMFKYNTNAWNIHIGNLSNNTQQEIYVGTTCNFNQAFPAVLEVDQTHPITACNQLPPPTIAGDGQFKGEVMMLANPNWNSYQVVNDSTIFQTRNSGTVLCNWLGAKAGTSPADYFLGQR